jgi:hypothetical protein
VSGSARRQRARHGAFLAAAALALAAPAARAAPLTETGRRAYEMARGADDAATAAAEEGEQTLARLRALAPEGELPAAVAALREEAEAARGALAGYRRVAEGSATEALGLLAEVAKLPDLPAPDVARRDTLEQHALLAAHEAAVMAARARAEAERLRAILAETRLEGGTPGGRGAGAAGPPAAGGDRGAAAARDPRLGRVVVPNLVGARLEAATRDLEARGLRLGPATGPRDGFVVMQSPDAGAQVPRGAPVGVTLSGTAATIGPPR